MQDWQVQAKKNELNILEDGKCQLCGSNTAKGLFECVGKSSLITHQFNHEDGIKYNTIFLCVDAHALQHSEIHGRWNNHFHLTRLNLILIENINWDYKLSPLLSNVVNSYKMKHLDEKIVSPEIGKRGFITISDVEKSSSDSDYIQLVNKWAVGVFESFIQGHEISKKISRLFKDKYFT